MDDVRSRVQRAVSRIAQQEASCDYDGGAIVVLLNPGQKTGVERKRSLARSLVLGKTHLAHSARFFDGALGYALDLCNSHFLRTAFGSFSVGVAGFSAEHNDHIARRVLADLCLIGPSPARHP